MLPPLRFYREKTREPLAIAQIHRMPIIFSTVFQTAKIGEVYSNDTIRDERVEKSHDPDQKRICLFRSTK